jgi:hypothetical protein
VFDPAKKTWVSYDWKQFYPDINAEVLPPGQPKARGNEVQITLFVMHHMQIVM